MSNTKKKYARNVVGIVVLAMLSACTSVTPVKEITADPAGYMAQKFSPQSLSPDIAKKLPSDANSASFGKFTITEEVTSEQNDGKKRSFKEVLTFFNSGNGLVQRMDELSSNDIPFSLYFALTYHNMVDLRLQRVPLGGVNFSSPIYEIKDIARFDPIPSSVDKEFVVDYTAGPDYQIANLTSSQKKCKATGIRAASEINKKLPGQATFFECQIRSNFSVLNRTKWALLQEYGVAILLEMTDSAVRNNFRVIDVNG